MKLIGQKSSKVFDFEDFKKAFDSEKQNNPGKVFDYDAFLKTFATQES